MCIRDRSDLWIRLWFTDIILLFRDFDEFPALTPDQVERRATLMDSIRQAGGMGRYRLRNRAESDKRLAERQGAMTTPFPGGGGPAAGRGRGRGVGRGDLMRDLSAQLQLRGRAAPIRTNRR